MLRSEAIYIFGMVSVTVDAAGKDCLSYTELARGASPRSGSSLVREVGVLWMANILRFINGQSYSMSFPEM